MAGQDPERRVSSTPRALYRSSGQPGFLPSISDDPRRVFARKRQHTVNVQFTPVACIVQTLEGTVSARPGDAIITGLAGEHWRVSRARFAEKYRPVPPLAAGESGAYVSLPNRVIAVRMESPFEVLLADGQSRLAGKPGDWLIDYGDGSLGIVAKTLFATTYEIID